MAFGVVSFLTLATAASALPALEMRQEVSTLSVPQVASFKPYTYYASTAYCNPSNTLAWNCGANCNANHGFQPVASGGDSAVIQYWYVGYDPSLEMVIVAYEGSDFQKIIPAITDVDFIPEDLDPSFFPGVNSTIKTHEGFQKAQEKSAQAVLTAVQNAMDKYSATKVTIVGHSLGGAIALISSVYLPLHLPSSTVFKIVTYGMPRVGNQAFVDYVNARYDVTRIVNKKDPVPTLPGRLFGFAHTHGEVHIINDGSWVSCPGQDNTDSQCTIGYVPNIFGSHPSDHDGPFDGVIMDC